MNRRKWLTAALLNGGSSTGLIPTMTAVEACRIVKDELIAAADLVTEMTLVKHHFAAGVKAQAGIEF